MAPKPTNYPCPLCEHEFTTVVKTAKHRRSRRCSGCGEHFTTYEIHQRNTHGGARKGPNFVNHMEQA